MVEEEGGGGKHDTYDKFFTTQPRRLRIPEASQTPVNNEN